MWKRLKLILALALLGSGAAHADAIGDLTAGSGLRFISARGRLGDASFTAGDWSLPKPPGTLNVTVPLSHFGLSSSTLVTLTGRREPGSRVIWSFDVTPSPAMVSGDTHIERVWGQIVADARLVSPSTSCTGAACAYNVELRPGPGSAIHVHGCQFVWPVCWGFDRDITVGGFLALGGVPPVRLNSMNIDLAASRCGSTEEVTLAGTVQLQSPAPAAGATVSLRSSHPGLRTRNAFVRAGERTGRFNVTLARGFASSGTITATSAGTSSAQVIDRVACPIWVWPSFVRLLPSQWLYRFLLDDGRVVAQGATTDVVVDPKSQQSFDLSSRLGLNEPRVSAISGRELIGTTKQGDAFVWNTAQDLPVVVKGGFSTVAVNPLGLGLARSTKTGDLTFLDQSGELAAPNLKGLEVTSARGNSAGKFAAGLVVNGKVQPALLDASGPQVLANGEGEATDVLASGEVIGWAIDSAKLQRAFRVPTGGSLKWLALPAGCTSAKVTAANEAGWIAGSALCGQLGTLAWLANPAGVVKRLDTVANLPSPPRQVLGLSADNTVLVRGDDTKSGAPFIFLLQP